MRLGLSQNGDGFVCVCVCYLGRMVFRLVNCICWFRLSDLSDPASSGNMFVWANHVFVVGSTKSGTAASTCIGFASTEFGAVSTEARFGLVRPNLQRPLDGRPTKRGAASAKSRLVPL